VWNGFANIAVFPFVFVQCLTPSVDSQKKDTQQ
jgi:hypothetical protein